MVGMATLVMEWYQNFFLASNVEMPDYRLPVKQTYGAVPAYCLLYSKINTNQHRNASKQGRILVWQSAPQPFLFAHQPWAGQRRFEVRVGWRGTAGVCNTGGLNPHFHHTHSITFHNIQFKCPSFAFTCAPVKPPHFKFTLLYFITTVCGDGLFLLAWRVIRTTVNIIKSHLPDKQPPHFRNVLASYLLPRREGHGSEESRCEVLHPGRDLADDLSPAGHLPCCLPSPGGGKGRGGRPM